MSGALYVGTPRKTELPWENEFIWFVPGNDPFGPAGWPEPGRPTFVWTRITNVTDHTADDIKVRFYFSPGGTELVRDRAVPIGTSFVSLGPKSSEQVVCLSPWTPEPPTTGGCIVVEAIHWLDPLPQEAGSVFGRTFNSSRLSQVGILNVAIYGPEDAPQSGRIVQELLVPWLPDHPSTTIHLSDDTPRLTPALLRNWGLDELTPGDVADCGLARSPDAADEDWKGRKELTVESIPEHGIERMFVIGVFRDARPKGAYKAVRVADRRKNGYVGGFTVIFKDKTPS